MMKSVQVPPFYILGFFASLLFSIPNSKFFFTHYIYKYLLIFTFHFQFQLQCKDSIAHTETIFQNVFDNIDPETGAVTYRSDIADAGIGDWVSVCPSTRIAIWWTRCARAATTPAPSCAARAMTKPDGAR